MHPFPLQLVRGVPTLVSVVGGSNTVGHGAHNGFPWPRYLYEWLKDAFPKTDITVRTHMFGWMDEPVGNAGRVGTELVVGPKHCKF